MGIFTKNYGSIFQNFYDCINSHILEFVEFFSENVWKIIEKDQNCVNSEKCSSKIQFIGFLYQKNLDQIFKIFST